VAPGFDPRLPHDFAHYAAELELGIAHGVFGQLALGGDLRTFRRLDGTPDRRLRRRGERLLRLHHDALAHSERVAHRAMVAWSRGGRAPAEEGLEAVCERLERLGERRRDLGAGGTLTVHWPETARSDALHGAGPPERRTAHRRRAIR
jgi:hypothetical protein